jgi:hypothetical protein
VRKSWTDNSGGWKRRFAFLPIYLSDGPNRQIIWLEWVMIRDNGYYREVSVILDKQDENT